ncbi:MAG: 3-isopropylmalate dehydratase [Gammaproteobacteria bacterium]|nr:MAG: 3-isopropylmalate dehydratase [Gammaproteobacteria bacterium]
MAKVEESGSDPNSKLVIRGAAWVFGDEINTDTMAPGRYFKEPMEVMAVHCLEAVDPEFAPNVKPGDVIVAGNNFGLGSAREQAPMAFAHLGIGAILAESFSRIFYRNAINFGIPLLFFPQAKEIEAGQLLEVNPVEGMIRNVTSGQTYLVEGIPEHLMYMINAGGLMPWLKEKYSNR